MNELAKLPEIIDRDAAKETLLVLDATTGRDESFRRVPSSRRRGADRHWTERPRWCVIAIAQELQTPVKFIAPVRRARVGTNGRKNTRKRYEDEHAPRARATDFVKFPEGGAAHGVAERESALLRIGGGARAPHM